MKSKFQFLEIALLTLVLSLMLGGCATKENPRLFWPPPPDDPKLEYVHAYYSEQDFPQTGSESFVTSIIGNAPASAFARPFGVATHEDRIYISEPVRASVQIFDTTARTDRRMVKETGVLRQPMGLTVGAENQLYVADAKARRVLVFALPDNQIVGNIKYPEGFRTPTFLALDDQLDRLYVSDPGAGKVFAFSQAGEFMFSLPQTGSGISLHKPAGIAVNRDGKIFVADQFNFQIKVFDADGSFLYSFGEQGDRPGAFELPRDLAFDSDGHLYVVDFRKSALMIFEVDGTFLLQLGGKRTGLESGFSTPTSVWIDANDRIYITDQINRRFTVWQYMSADYLERHPVTEEDLEYIRSLIKKKSKLRD